MLLWRTQGVSSNDVTILNAWVNVENGSYNFNDFIRIIAYSPDKIIRSELGETDFPHLKSLIYNINHNNYIFLKVINSLFNATLKFYHLEA